MDSLPAAARELLQCDGAALRRRWEGCQDAAALEAAIRQYREALEAVLEECKRLGLDMAGEEGPSGSGEAEEAGEGQEGIEGVDWRYGSVEELDPSEWQVPPHCIPIHANVTTYDWSRLIASTQFDVIMMDPPWQLATANPTRGVALGYSQLTDAHIANLPIPRLQQNGLLFVWVINAKYQFCLDLFDQWGYELVDEIVWVKMTVNRRLAKSHGFYLQHAKEVCLVARKGEDPPGMQSGVGSDVIYSERRGQSQKPEEIYQLIEKLVPNGRYLEIFGRKNNLRNFWVTIGNEVTGQGPPKEDQRALEEGLRIPNAVYGRAG
ncbi:N6-adenosine-methyltransferase 70 kDa subunit [Chlorella sorokiniana]|uniref:mRNA m(6)A methyltransferase n=1 Tax=Chlorella sorokiniana TaxID=3076 RepID=A0A2P6TPF1_CHLSO|nr:N6-adenosine-methyltransferase 70 kDa subunit [Chlorella sorokiniana]|eukprot:PRW55917.1 N6-adenosine-methyltransferase 70 kDa subunit [Chlorella sorokiniana]